jgi:hypothetical protein
VEPLRRLSVMDAMAIWSAISGRLTMLDGVPQSFIERNDQKTVAVPDHDLGYDF